jgi:hypothetical protein
MARPDIVLNGLSSPSLKLNRAAEMTIFANPLPSDQLLSLVKSSGGLDLPHQEDPCLSPPLVTRNEQEQELSGMIVHLSC